MIWCSITWIICSRYMDIAAYYNVKDGGFAKCCVAPKNAPGSLGRVS